MVFSSLSTYMNVIIVHSVAMQSQWYLRQIRDEFMSIAPTKTHTHARDPCFRFAYNDTFAARRIASRYMPEEVVQLSSRKLYPTRDYFEEWVSIIADFVMKTES
ncbi:hypothetical protein Ddye_015061 [Dipteronia dyeriana]|uniref:Uncharacterized protein n=1 Tax=Dipteronia dyeriana TaxID=168575 RepID=A0AAD9U481_9ROSI|nr:hypothetical protein Ddye_015061 [Dipteronia dyeriana]